MFKNFKIILFLSLFVFSVTQAQESTCKSEIDHLLATIKKTQCTYLRNGSSYTGVEAFEHINKKYIYYIDDIQSAEDFIRLSASESSMTGRPYYIKCPGEENVKSAVWLQKVLDKYRRK